MKHYIFISGQEEAYICEAQLTQDEVALLPQLADQALYYDDELDVPAARDLLVKISEKCTGYKNDGSCAEAWPRLPSHGVTEVGTITRLYHIL